MDGKIYALLQGEKGLYYTDGVRIYFPDRKWTEAKLGFFTDLHVTIEKENYSFISGKMIETLPLSMETFFEAQPFKLTSTYYNQLIGDTMVVVEKDVQGNWTVFANTVDGVKAVFFTDDYITGYTRMEKIHYRRNCFTDVMFRHNQKVDTTAQKKAWYSSNCVLDESGIMTACIRIRSLVEMLYRQFIDFKVYDNTFVVVKSQHKYCDEPSEFTFVYDGREIIELSDVNTKALGKLTKTISAEELEKFAVDNHICFGYGERTERYDDIVSTELKALGVELTIYGWRGSEFTMDKLQNADKVAFIEKSYSELQATVKRVGKSCTGRLVQELQKLNPRPWLLHK